MADSKWKKPEKADITVRIQKLKINFKLFFDYFPFLSEYIKRLPKDHRKLEVSATQDMDGKIQKSYAWIISETKMGEIISFLIDNKMNFVFENVTDDVLQRLRDEFIQRQKRIAQILKLKAEQLDVSGDDFSFMKIQPYEYQKKAD